MRKDGLVFLFLCQLLCGLGYAAAHTLAEQERVELKWRQVPKEVRRNVRLAYPYHIYRDWARVDTLYSVRVISANYETVYFDSTGEWLRAYRPVRPSELPYRTYLFLKEEFGVYRVLRAYQVQQSDDLAHYSVEMEHKRIPTLKTYLEFDFVGDLTMLDGNPVGGSEETEETEALSREAFLALYADVYDPEAEEAAYAQEAARKAAAAQEVPAETETGPIAGAAGEPADDTLALAAEAADAVMAEEPVADTLPPVAEAVEPAAVDTLPSVAEVVSEPEPIPADVTPITVVALEADTVDLLAGDEVTPEPAPESEPMVVDTTSVAEAEPVAVTTPEPAAEPVPAPDTAVLAAVPDTAAAMADTAPAPAPLFPEVVGTAFKKRFPNVDKVVWHRADSLYLVTFTQFGQVMAAAFREDGVQIYTAYAFNRKEMPLPIDRYLQVSAAKMKMTEGWRVAYESKYKRMFAASDRPKDYYYVIMGRKVPKSKKWQYIRYQFNQNAQFEAKSNYVQPSEK